MIYQGIPPLAYSLPGSLSCLQLRVIAGPTVPGSPPLWALQVSNLGPPPCKGEEDEVSTSGDPEKPRSDEENVRYVAIRSHSFVRLLWHGRGTPSPTSRRRDRGR
jgi:hypothetical protein